jgi:hypothetical protein
MSLLGLAGGGLSGSATGAGPATSGTGPASITVNNGGALSTSTILLIGGLTVGGLLIFALIRGRK